ncbi:HemK2/MTQ2 family protein methyltransferase [Pseudonocardia asaccharolytica]|uniref:Methyltransferase n=1 Tax=Pseudonocardia asaccharolytica DSM 44247 = NBRC 16224 TaxID=1123024 RepID=A0A511CWI5_9PSEU|nr:HemK2/MTQ2 family protein methyltransferase [Pseudonocardia asaccharolytica]GEL16935.1 methyltransferase [Pseudonocardia asaccharolytica DSM 44247 = NBRC 16224]
MLLRPPGVYRADGDTTLLIDVLRAGGYAAGRRVLDLGTGTGALALAAARAGAASVTAVDLSLRSVAAAWFNAQVSRTPVTVRWGDLFGPVRGERFDLLLANPPYVPAEAVAPPRHRITRCWDAGPDGRLLLDRICAGAADMLTDDGVALIVHSTVCDEDTTVAALQATGMKSQVVARTTIPFGPVMRARAGLLAARGLVQPDQRDEEIVVVEARHRA